MTSIPNNTTLWGSSTSDVTLICEGQSFRCHRDILAHGSDHFRALLLGESNSSTVGLSEDTPASLELLLKSLYGFPLATAVEHYRTFPGVPAYLDRHPLEPRVPCPTSMSVTLVPWMKQMIGLYITARKYLCDSICAQLMAETHLPNAVKELLGDFRDSNRLIRPDVALVSEVFGLVYTDVPDNCDPLRCYIAKYVAYHQRCELYFQERWEPEIELRVPGLLAALPDLEMDVEIVRLQQAKEAEQAQQTEDAREWSSDSDGNSSMYEFSDKESDYDFDEDEADSWERSYWSERSCW